MIGVYRGIVDLGRKTDRAGGLVCGNDGCLSPAQMSACAVGIGDGKQDICCQPFSSTADTLSLLGLRTNQAIIPTNTHIETYSSALPALILQSLADIILSSRADIAVSYSRILKERPKPQTQGYTDCAFLAVRDPDLAAVNAEGFKYLALSMWLGEVDWAAGFAQKRPDTEDDVWAQFEEENENEKIQQQSPIDLRGNDDERGSDRGINVDMERVGKARDMIDAMTKTQLEYQGTHPPKPTRHSSFVSVAEPDVAEL